MSYSQFADGTARESALRQERPARSEDLSMELQGEPQGLQPTETKDGAEARNDFWSIEGDFIYCHHIEPRVQLYVAKEETFPIPLKYTDVTRTTHTSLDVLQEKRIDDHWNDDVDRSVSDSRTGFTKVTLLNNKHPKRIYVSPRRLTKNQTTTRPDYLWPEI